MTSAVSDKRLSDKEISRIRAVLDKRASGRQVMISDLMLYGTKVALLVAWPHWRSNPWRPGVDFRDAASGPPP